MAKNKKAEVTFEEALAELEKHVEQLETGELGLDKALGTYEKGVKALRECQRILAEAERRIEVLTRLDEEGQPVTDRFDRADATAAGLDEQEQENDEDGPQMNAYAR
jgi:exodeoxyribonuclease VII small subunit